MPSGRIEKRISTLKTRLDAEIDRIPYEAENEYENSQHHLKTPKSTKSKLQFKNQAYHPSPDKRSKSQTPAKKETMK